ILQVLLPLAKKALDSLHIQVSAVLLNSRRFATHALGCSCAVLTLVLHMGTFVQLRVELAQTHCRKQQRRTHNCLVKPGGVSPRASMRLLLGSAADPFTV
uniref:Uncharacterized protein n=1 Tax=Varanus komodoensis TaxID=61221 RepID=A0A8D2Q2W5_VARKO